MDDFSRHLDTISDGLAQLESRLELGPDPLLEAATKDIRFGRDGLARILAAHLEALEEVVVDPVTSNLVIGDFELVDEVFDSGDFELVYEEEGATDK